MHQVNWTRVQLNVSFLSNTLGFGSGSEDHSAVPPSHEHPQKSKANELNPGEKSLDKHRLNNISWHVIEPILSKIRKLLLNRNPIKWKRSILKSAIYNEPQKSRVNEGTHKDNHHNNTSYLTFSAETNLLNNLHIGKFKYVINENSYTRGSQLNGFLTRGIFNIFFA